MKKRVQFILAFIAVATLGFTGCKKDDNGGYIVGKWSQVSISEKAVSPTNQTVYENNMTIAEGHMVVEFKADGTYSYFTDGEEDGGKYSVNGNKLTMTEDLGEDGIETTEAEFTISGNTLTLIQNNPNWEGNNHYTATIIFKKK